VRICFLFKKNVHHTSSSKLKYYYIFQYSWTAAEDRQGRTRNSFFHHAKSIQCHSVVFTARILNSVNRWWGPRLPLSGTPLSIWATESYISRSGITFYIMRIVSRMNEFLSEYVIAVLRFTYNCKQNYCVFSVPICSFQTYKPVDEFGRQLFW